MSTLQSLFTDELRDLYDAEKQLVKALPSMSKAARRPELKKALTEHLEVTRGQVERLERIFGMIDQKPRSKPCAGMKGLVEEGREVMAEHAGESTLDPALIGAAQRVEHYEMAGYMSARMLAEALGLSKAAQLLDKTAREEEKTDQKLSQIAMKILKDEARSAASDSGRAASTAKARKAGANGNATRGASNGRGGRKSSGRASAAGSITTTDHDEIRRWAEDRGAEPACVKGTGGRGDSGVLRLDFPGYSGGESLQHISWDEFFEKFDENRLALLYQEKTAGGKPSNFNKLVAR